MKHDRQQLDRLRPLCRLLPDAALARLAAQRQAEAALRRQLAGLDAPLPPATELRPGALDTAQIRYGHWAGPRRMEINEALARQIVARMNAETAARRALGRSMAMEGIAAARRNGLPDQGS